MSRKMLFLAIVCGLIAFAVQPASAATPSLAGSWQFTLTTGVTPIPVTAVTSTPTPLAGGIPGLATFTADGSVIETDGSEFATVPSSTVTVGKASSPGHGIWQLGSVVGSTVETFDVQYVSLVLNVDGTLYARNTTTMSLTLDKTGTTFKGTYTTYQALITSALTRILSSGTVTGQLIPHVAP